MRGPLHACGSRLGGDVLRARTVACGRNPVDLCSHLARQRAAFPTDASLSVLLRQSAHADPAAAVLPDADAGRIREWQCGGAVGADLPAPGPAVLPAAPCAALGRGVSLR